MPYLNRDGGELPGKGRAAMAATHGVAVAYCGADLTRPAEIAALAETTVKELGGIDILVNSAGIAGPTATVLDITMEDWHRTIAINLNGTFRMTRSAVPAADTAAST